MATNDAPKQLITLTEDQFSAILSKLGGPNAEEQKSLILLQAEENAKAQKKALRPENERHPGHSVYAYKEGDLARPRPSMTCPTFWVGQPVEGDVDTAEEMELLNQLPLGNYTCSKSDGSQFRVTVEGDRDPVTGKLSQKAVWFPTRGEHKNNLNSRVTMLREMLSQVSVTA
jgi:hypothetical protein